MIDAIEAKVIDMNAEALGVPGSQLMENAGKLSAKFIKDNMLSRTAWTFMVFQLRNPARRWRAF